MSAPGWTHVPPIAGGNDDVYRCDGPTCGALVRASDTGAAMRHDREFHDEDKPESIAFWVDVQHEAQIVGTRYRIRAAVTAAQRNLSEIERMAQMLGDGPGNLYDVEFTESLDETVCLDAIRQASVALAAIAHTARETP